jgi:hypothetical protein
MTGSLRPLTSVYDLVDESVGRTHRGCDEKCVGVGEVAVHGLAGDSDPSGDIGKAYPRSLLCDDFV